MWQSFKCAARLVAAGVLAFAGAVHAFPADAEVREMLRPRVEAGDSIAIVVGMVDPSGSRVVAYGKATRGSHELADADSAFELALRTRVLEALEMHRTGIPFTLGMPAAGSLRSTGNEMVRFLEANLGLRESPLAEAMRMGLGWFHASYLGTRLAEHGGATDESRLRRARRRGAPRGGGTVPRHGRDPEHRHPPAGPTRTALPARSPEK